MRQLLALPVTLGVALLYASSSDSAAAGHASLDRTWKNSTSPSPSALSLPNSIIANDNRVAAGRLRNGVLTLAIEAREGTWHPDENPPPASRLPTPGLLVQAFGETGKPLRIPGPLIRVPAGTQILMSVRNDVPGATLRVFGLHARPHSGGATDTLVVAAGATREVSFRLDAPGTYHYWGTTTNVALNRRIRMDGQLSGAIVVDSVSGGRTTRDRIFVITSWSDTLDANGIPVPGTLFVPVINGKSWPHTERLKHAVGDSVRWRWINATNGSHPMHLHGFYYLIDSRGDAHRDSLYPPSARPRVVTERMPPGGTMAVTWVPERPGNWLFHCHVPRHVEAHMPLDRSKLPTSATAVHGINHSSHDMGGLVMGIHVKGRTGQRVSEDAPKHRLRLLARVDTGSTSEEPAYGFTLAGGDGRATRTAGLLPTPVLVLPRGEAVAITVVNELPEATAVHWHGIELESYFDGVPGFGGAPGRITPLIAAGDSFIVRFTPPRAGTFIYHTHVDERRQEPAGLSGIIVVTERGVPFDSASDHAVLLSTARRRADRERVYIMGSLNPLPLEWRAGQRHRLRLVNIMISPPLGVSVTLVKDSAALTWRPLAKDGADLPLSQAQPGPATVRMAIGETHDFEVIPDSPGDYRLEVRPANRPQILRGVLQIRVR